MLHTLLYKSSDFAIIAWVALVFSASGCFIFWVAFYPKFTKSLDKLIGVNQTLYGPVTTLFTFTAALLGASVWGHFANAQNAVGNERTALLGYLQVIETNAHLKSSGLQKALSEYVSAALSDEWTTIGQGDRSPKTIKIFNALFQASVEVAQQPEVSPIVSGALLRALENVRTA